MEDCALDEASLDEHDNELELLVGNKPRLLRSSNASSKGGGGGGKSSLPCLECATGLDEDWSRDE